ncbi:MAG: pyridoxine 5'-phosphate synthase [Pseudomonadota bacterium]|nr:pyridoxine 5'-phosphate synthase [Pseudomonadota bacterium]
MVSFLRLGVNVDHVATIRNARGGKHPDPVQAALLAVKAGADGITAHLREDRRHISDIDIERLVAEIGIPLNLEMAATDEILEIALRQRPHAACIVPEKRQERTTEGGLDVAADYNNLAPYVTALSASGIRVSLFIEPEAEQLDATHALGAPAVELHTGAYCDAVTGGRVADQVRELERIHKAARHATAIGLECHAGHGLGFGSVGAIAEILEIVELNIGHFLIGEAIFSGLDNAIRRMRVLMDTARAENSGNQTA